MLNYKLNFYDRLQDLNDKKSARHAHIKRWLITHYLLVTYIYVMENI